MCTSVSGSIDATITAGKQSLFVEVRTEALPEGQPGVWGYYPLSQITALVNWLDTGSQNEFELAENIYQAFQPQIYAEADDQMVSHHQNLYVTGIE